MDEDYGGSSALYPIILNETGTFNFPVIVQTLSKNYFPIIMKLMVKYYIPNYHLWRLLGLSKAGLMEYLSKVYDWIGEGESLVALHPKSGKVLGFMIGTVVETSDGHQEQENIAVYNAKEVQAVFDFYNFMYHSIDFSVAHNTNLKYNLYIWMVLPKVKRKSQIIYELYIALLKFCELLDIKTVTAIVTKEKETYFAKYFGFQIIKQVNYYEFFHGYNIIDENVLEEEYLGFFLSFLVNQTRRKQQFTDSQSVCLVLPKLTKQKEKLWDKSYWQHLFWDALKKEFLTPSLIKKYIPENILI